MFKNLRNKIADIIAPTKNALTPAQEFFKYGSTRGRMDPNWSMITMNDEDFYTGYGYAAIKKRASIVASVAQDNVFTLVDGEDKKDFEHPYLPLIWDSLNFSEYSFWSTISTYLDLKGVFYLFVLRNGDGSRIGDALEFKLLNPYEITRVVRQDTMELGGYIETRDGFTREIPPHMIIEIKELNPFRWDKPYAMTNAAKESQFTLRASGDYTRNSLRNNIEAPGILSTSVQLDQERFKNFVERVRNHTKGEPLFGNGAGAIDWEPMTADLSKSALKEVHEVNRDILFAVSGQSKTMMGIEQSGTTRETAKVQKDLNMETEILPRIQTIIDALDLDYRNKYQQDFARNKAYIDVKNPNATDHDADQKDTTVKKDQFELYQDMINKGYDSDLAAQYINGDLTLEQLGEPTNEPKIQPVLPGQNQPPQEDDIETNSFQKKKTHDHECDIDCESLTVNNLSQHDMNVLKQQQQMLKNAVINVQERLVAAAISRVQKNAIDEESDVVSKSEKKKAANELATVLAAFYSVIYLMRGPQIAQDRSEEFEMSASFTLTTVAKEFIRTVSRKVALSHADTVAGELYKAAREAALRGLSQEEIVSQLRKEYVESISKGRAEVIARTETNRAFTTAQYQADDQFIKQNKLEGRVLKQWITRSNDPCEFCKSLAKEPPIPFYENFRNLGTDVTVGDQTLPVNYMPLESGNAHPNCFCAYKFIILKEL